VKQVLVDLEGMNNLIMDPNRHLTGKISHGDGQTLLREALLVADHNVIIWVNRSWFAAY
jgi:hypothetical protein